MPFTASHPAAVLPLFRTGLFPAALVIGSMAPDLPYYLPVPDVRSFTHSLAGLLTVDLAMSLAAFVLWVWLLAPAATAIAGPGLRRRMPPGSPEPLRRYLGARAAALVVVSSLVGGVTHLVWDAFTHPGTWGTARVGWLAHQHGPLAGYRWTQYASGLIGAAVLVAAFHRWWSRTPAVADAPEVGGTPGLAAVVLTAVGAATLSGALIGAWYGMREPGGGPWIAAFRAATVGGGCGAAAALGFSVLWRFSVLRRVSG